MQNRFGFAPKFRGFVDVKGLEAAQKVAAEMVWRKPWLTFSVPGQIFVDAEGNYVPGGSPADGLEMRDGLVDFHFQIDPSKNDQRFQNLLAAIRDQLTAAQQIIEKYATAQSANGAAKPSRVTREQLPDRDTMAQLYNEQDQIADQRLVAMVVKSELGTHWDYVDSSGNTPELTLAFLSNNPLVAEAMQTALSDFLRRSKESSDAASSAKVVNGSTVTTALIQNPSSAASVGASTAPELAQTNTAPDSSQVGIPPLN